LLGGTAALILLTLLVCWAGWRLTRRLQGKGAPPTLVPIASPRPTSTPAAQEIPLTSPMIVPLVSSQDVRAAPAIPITLRVNGRTFPIVPDYRAGTGWPAPPTVPEQARWASGTLVNYLIGLAPDEENRALLEGLEEGNELILEMSTGVRLRFQVQGPAGPPEDEAALLAQNKPGLTLVLLTEEPQQRLVVTAGYAGEETSLPPELVAAPQGEVGEQVQTASVRVSVLETRVVRAAEAGLPPGSAYYLVDFSVENIGRQVLDPNLFQMELRDGAGNVYPLTLSANQFANYGLPTDPLKPGETVIGSAGYLIPEQFPAEELRWTFNPLPGSDQWVQVLLPYATPTPAPTPPPAVGYAEVYLDDAFLSKDGELLIVEGEVYNPSSAPVTLEAEAIRLSSSAGLAELVSTAPLLPITIAPGDSQIIELQFRRPAADSAVLEVLGYAFEISGLGS